MQKTTNIRHYGTSKGLMEKGQTNHTEFLRFGCSSCFTCITGKVICGFASGYAFLILFVLALDASNMTFGRIGQIGDFASVRVPLPLLSHKIVLWNTRVETLDLAKFIAILSIFAVCSLASIIIFLQIKNIYNIFLILGLEYLPAPFIGKYLNAQGFALYVTMFIIGVCLICYSTALRTFLKPAEV